MKERAREGEKREDMKDSNDYRGIRSISRVLASSTSMVSDTFALGADRPARVDQLVYVLINRLSIPGHELVAFTKMFRKLNQNPF